MLLVSDIKKYVFRYIDSNMYIIVEDHEALVLDPHIDLEADAYLKENNVENVTILLTHEHFDHTCGIPWFRQRYNTTVICQEKALDSRIQRFCGRPITVSLILSDQGRDKEKEELEKEYPQFTFSAEKTFSEEYDFLWHEHTIHMEHIPGHSPASSLIVIDGKNVFTGDSLIPGCEPTLRWPGSDKEMYHRITVPRLLKIPEGSVIFPGHRDIIELHHIIFENSIWKLYG